MSDVRCVVLFRFLSVLCYVGYIVMMPLNLIQVLSLTSFFAQILRHINIDLK